MRIRLVCFIALFFVVLAALPSSGQNAPSDPQGAPSSNPADSAATQTKPADPQPLPMPSMSGPLQAAVPHEVEGGKLAFTGILSGIGLTEGNHVSGDDSTHWEVSNAQIFVQRLAVGGNFICRAAPTTCQLSECHSSRPQTQ